MVNEGRREGHGVDSINALPDVILQHILSYIPTRFAIRTAVLSKRWRHIWSDIPSLSFDLYWRGAQADSINVTLARYTAPKMKIFKLCTSMIENIPYIDKLIEFSMSRNVENMSLHLGFRNDEYTIPDWFYIYSSVKQLSIELNFNRMKIPSCLVSWTSLKKLSLRSCIISDECIAKVLSGCPILESLSLHSFNSYDEPKVLDLSKSLLLRTLEISRTCAPELMMQIVAPHISCLRLRDYQLPCTLVDVSSLTEASLDISFSPFEKLEVERLQVMALKMLDQLRNVEKLSFGSNFIKILSLAELQLVPFPIFSVKDLKFKTLVSQYVIPGIVRVLQNSPELKKLTLHTKNHNNTPVDCMNNCLDLQGLNSDQCWSSKVKLFVNINPRSVESKHVVSFMELMLKNTKTLEKMVARLKGRYLKGIAFEELLEMVPMLSQNNNNVSIVLRKES